MKNKRHPRLLYLPGDYKGFRRSVPGTWDKGQIAYFLYITVSHRCREVVIPKVIRPDGGRPECEPEISDSRALPFPWYHSGLGSTAADGAHGPTSASSRLLLPSVGGGSCWTSPDQHPTIPCPLLSPLSFQSSSSWGVDIGQQLLEKALRVGSVEELRKWYWGWGAAGGPGKPHFPYL